MPPSHITLQQLVLPTRYAQLPDLDAHFAGMGVSLPPSILLDYMYGAAAYRCWGAGQGIEGMMQNRFSAHYENIPMPPPSPTSSTSSNPGSIYDSSNGDKFKPLPRRRYYKLDMPAGMLQAMDSILLLSMWVKGTTPEAMAAERQRQEEEEELRVQKAGQVKVLDWLQSDVNEDPTLASPYYSMDEASSPQDLE
ncbi:hypothetical protein FIBSPDRAFT_969021 [Athelia psychrophila]|uniref:Uncharacterized protein n=1 Tax=Athelia psychrophila TaxID=1759441 RepID=A0A167TYQ7_9AGAM|nr:hypothetical protein FIBSPDRAFT_969021 [Fibularhizoctonia sp. CBS 109695]